MNCKICGEPIPEVRLELQPRIKTCSRSCSVENQRRLNAEGQRRFRARAKAAKAELASKQNDGV